MIKIAKRSNLTRVQERPPRRLGLTGQGLPEAFRRWGLKTESRRSAPVRRTGEDQDALKNWSRKAAQSSSSPISPAGTAPASTASAASAAAASAPAASAAPDRAEKPAAAGQSPARVYPALSRLGVQAAARKTPWDRNTTPVSSNAFENAAVERPVSSTSESLSANSALGFPPPQAAQPADPRSAAQGSREKTPMPVSNSPAPQRPGLETAAVDKRPVCSLDRLLEQNRSLPAQTAILGVCEDTLPVLLDLKDPTPGALLVIGDERTEQLRLLRNAVASVARRNSPHGIQFMVISNDPNSWKQWISGQGFERYCLAVESADSETVGDWIIRLADWTEQRRLGQRGGPPVLLVMDTLSFLARIPYDVRLNFEWMAKEGPYAQMWPLAAISTRLVKELSGRRLLRSFRTRLLGRVEDPAVYGEVAGGEGLSTGAMKAGQFAVRMGENWLRFCQPG